MEFGCYCRLQCMTLVLQIIYVHSNLSGVQSSCGNPKPWDKTVLEPLKSQDIGTQTIDVMLKPRQSVPYATSLNMSLVSQLGGELASVFLKRSGGMIRIILQQMQENELTEETEFATDRIFKANEWTVMSLEVTDDMLRFSIGLLKGKYPKVGKLLSLDPHLRTKLTLRMQPRPGNIFQICLDKENPHGCEILPPSMLPITRKLMENYTDKSGLTRQIKFWLKPIATITKDPVLGERTRKGRNDKCLAVVLEVTPEKKIVANVIGNPLGRTQMHCGIEAFNWNRVIIIITDNRSSISTEPYGKDVVQNEKILSSHPFLGSEIELNFKNSLDGYHFFICLEAETESRSRVLMYSCIGAAVLIMLILQALLYRIYLLHKQKRTRREEVSAQTSQSTMYEVPIGKPRDKLPIPDNNSRSVGAFRSSLRGATASASARPSCLTHGRSTIPKNFLSCTHPKNIQREPHPTKCLSERPEKRFPVQNSCYGYNDPDEIYHENVYDSLDIEDIPNPRSATISEHRAPVKRLKARIPYTLMVRKKKVRKPIVNNMGRKQISNIIDRPSRPLPYIVTKIQ